MFKNVQDCLMHVLMLKDILAFYVHRCARLVDTSQCSELGHYLGQANEAEHVETAQKTHRADRRDNEKAGSSRRRGHLYLTISKTGAGVSRRWTFLYSLARKQREAGLGPAAVVTLAEAREKAAEYRALLAKGN